MIPIYMAQGLANGRRLAVAGGSAALAPRAYEARAI
jgi:hypothetical protein